MKIFIDSSILIEYIKGTKTELLDKLLSSDCELYSNSIVYSEFMFHYLAVMGEKSPLTLKVKKQIKVLTEKYNPIEIFSEIRILSIDNEIVLLSYEFMKKYNFLPNDALILATVKLSGISHFATFDENDFKNPCKIEKIKLLKSLDDL